MRRRIKIIYPTRKPTFLEQLEERARSLVKSRRKGTSIEASLVDEIAVTLDHLDSTRQLHKRLRHAIVRKECYIGTEILALKPREPVYEDRYRGIRDMLRGRLLALAAEQRRLDQIEHEKVQGLKDRLWEQMRRRFLLSGQKSEPMVPEDA